MQSVVNPEGYESVPRSSVSFRQRVFREGTLCHLATLQLRAVTDISANQLLLHFVHMPLFEGASFTME